MPAMSCVALGFIGGAPGGGEILLIFVVLLLLFGAKNVPKMARTLGRTMEEFRRAAREVTDEVMRSPEDTPPSKTLPEATAPDEDDTHDAAPQ